MREKGPIQKAIDNDMCPKCECFVDYTVDAAKCDVCGLVIMRAEKSTQTTLSFYRPNVVRD